MTKIVAFGGRKQSGKSTACNFIGGLLLSRFGQIPDFILSEEGELLIEGQVIDINTISPKVVKVYAFADRLKEFCMNVLGLPHPSVYGTDQEKNQLTHVKWESIPGCITNQLLYNWIQKRASQKIKLNDDYKGSMNVFYHEPGYMTGREVLQCFGTEIVRSLYDPAWIESCRRNIVKDAPVYAFISDMRFANEARAVEAWGGHTVHLKRNMDKPISHASECEMDEYPKFSLVVDNRDITLTEFKQALVSEFSNTNILKPSWQ